MRPLNPPEPFREASISAAALTNNAEVGRWGYEGTRPELPLDMDVDRYFPVRVAIGHPHGAWGYGVLDLLGWLTAAVETIIDWFEPCFLRGGRVLPLSDLDVPLGFWDMRNSLLSQ